MLRGRCLLVKFYRRFSTWLAFPDPVFPCGFRTSLSLQTPLVMRNEYNVVGGREDAIKINIDGAVAGMDYEMSNGRSGCPGTCLLSSLLSVLRRLSKGCQVCEGLSLWRAFQQPGRIVNSQINNARDSSIPWTERVTGTKCKVPFLDSLAGLFFHQGGNNPMNPPYSSGAGQGFGACLKYSVEHESPLDPRWPCADTECACAA